MIKSLYNIAVVVSNAQNAKAWYTEKLGFKLVDDKGHWVTVAPSGAESCGAIIHLCENKATEPGNTGVSFIAEDMDRTVAELKERGVKFTQEPADKGWGKAAMFEDPDENIFWLYSNSR